MRRIISMTMLVALILTPVPGSAGGAKPVHSGTILSGDGWFLENSQGGCQTSPDCAAWLQSGCNPALSGHDPAVMASIENVADLAGDRKRRAFRFGPGGPGALVWEGTVVQLWRKNCTEIRSSRWRATDCDGKGGNCTSTRFRIPASTGWMTVTSYPENVNLVWTLT